MPPPPWYHQCLITSFSNYFINFNRLLTSVQKLANDVPLENNTTKLYAVKKNIALGITLFDPTSVTGFLAIQGKTTPQTGFNNLEMKTAMTEQIEANDIASINLPASLIQRAGSNDSSFSRVTSFLFDNSKLFSPETNLSSVNKMLDSKVLSSSIKGVTVTNLKEEEEMRAFFSPLNQNVTGNVNCVYWNSTASGN